MGEETTAESRERGLKHLRILCTRCSEARRESFCPLGRDLSWMSGSQSKRNHRREARTRAEAPKSFMHALLPKRVGRAFALLTRTYHGWRKIIRLGATAVMQERELKHLRVLCTRFSLSAS